MPGNFIAHHNSYFSEALFQEASDEEIESVLMDLSVGWSGFIEAEARFFFNEPLFLDQYRDNGSLAVQLEYYHEWENGSSFTFSPFVRFDSADSERTHFDIRELNYLWLDDEWEMRLGFSKVFWGANEFVHLVDIINQTDLIENIDGEDKLGQPMVNLSLVRDWGIVDIFLLPWFRERTYPGPNGRFRTHPIIETDKSRFESGAAEHHLDQAFRFSNTFGDCDIGVYNFNGTSREPTINLEFDKYNQPILVPFYEQINQTGIDVQCIYDEWLLKMEAFYRTGQADDVLACVGGFEYSFFGIAESDMDLGLIGEYAYDNRGADATSPFQNDVMLGVRLATNDIAGSELLVGVMQDMENSSRMLSIEASYRINSNWKVNLEARAFFDQPKNDLLYSLRDDDFLLLKLVYYF